jgi:protein-S-isoprenylcysteine O-methyltransferase Ste14
MNTFLNPTNLILPLTLGIIAIRGYWIITEAHAYKHRINRGMLKTNAVEAAILIAQALSAIFIPWPANPLNPYLTLFGLFIYLLGAIIGLWSRFTMSGAWGIPGERYKNQTSLVTTGPFAFSRNPIYVAFTFIYTGYCLAIHSWLLILRIPLFVYFYKSALKEEKDLEKEFGTAYTRYKHRVPRFLFI